MDTVHIKHEIEEFIRQWEDTAIGESVKNRYDNSDGSEESLADIIELIENAR